MLANGSAWSNRPCWARLLGLMVLLPFVFLRSLGAGDWSFGWSLGSVRRSASAGGSAHGLRLRGRDHGLGVGDLQKDVFKETLRNIGRLLLSMLTLRMPGLEGFAQEPQSLKVPAPDGVALTLTTLLFCVGKIWDEDLGERDSDETVGLENMARFGAKR